MANPAAAIEEAIGANLDGWKADDGKELWAFIKALPDLIDKLGSAIGGALSDADESGDLEETVGEEISHVEEAMNTAQGAAQELAEQFHHHYKFFLDGDS
jgi:hypothetical protein